MKELPSELKDFLVTGVLGKWHNEMTIEETIALLGKPDWSKEENMGDSIHLLRIDYDNLEIAFVNGSMYLIEITYKYPMNKVGIPDELCVGWYTALKGISYDEFISFLKRNEIRAHRVIFNVDPAQKSGLLEIQSTGTQVAFNEQGIIEQILYAPSRPGNYTYAEI